MIAEKARVLERIVEFSPAYDKQAEGYGVGSASLRFVLKGEEGAVQFLVFTGWNLPDVVKTQKLRGRGISEPMAADLGYHSPVPMYEGQSPISEEPCPWLDGKPCYYDGSALNAEPVLERLLREGDAGVWDTLTEYYGELFGNA